VKLTKIGIDYFVVDEKNVGESSLLNIDKIHLIKLNFAEPTREKIQDVILAYPRTNRFVISNNIKLYNDTLKATTKKYYVENERGASLISFLRKNNKILLNFNALRDYELAFLTKEEILYDLLRNIEVIQVDKFIYTDFAKIFNSWDGNCIVQE
jgi:hypothetical protein